MNIGSKDFARENYVNHGLNDQTSITRFIEDNWLGGDRISDGEDTSGFPVSYDVKAGSPLDPFDFSKAHQAKDQAQKRRLFLDPKIGLVLEQPPQ